MHIVGLTGGIGSGKSEAAKNFLVLGVAVIDLDNISRDLTLKDGLGYTAIIKYFGNIFLDANKNIDRGKLRRKIFEDGNTKSIVESILHPLIYKECLQQVQKIYKASYIVIVIPLLFESSKYLKLIDESLLIDCSEEFQIDRVQKRDGETPALTKLILKSQVNRKERIAKADKIVINDGSLEDLSIKIRHFHENTLKKIGLNL